MTVNAFNQREALKMAQQQAARKASMRMEQVSSQPTSELDAETIKRIVSEVVAGHFEEALVEERAALRREARSYGEEAKEQLLESVAGMVVQAVSEQVPVEVVHTFKAPNVPPVTLKGEVVHPMMERVLRHARCRFNILLVGPSGSGKSHCTRQAARILGMQDRYGIISCNPSTTERIFCGRAVPQVTTGEMIFKAPQFLDLYENGGMFVLDEFDAAPADVLVGLNAAADREGCLPVPDRADKPIAHRHPDFILAATANTWGTGASREYCGRNAIDEATLDRFRMGTTPCDYSTEIERKLCPDIALYKILKMWRQRMMENRIRRIVSTRFFRDAFVDVCAGATMADIELSLFGSWREDETVKVLGRKLKY